MEKKIYIIVVGDFADKDIEAVFDNKEDLQKYLDEFQIYDVPIHVEVKYLNPKPGGKTEPDYNDERYPAFEKKKS